VAEFFASIFYPGTLQSSSKLIEKVEAMYRKFLVIKAIEAHSMFPSESPYKLYQPGKQDPGYSDPWKVRCQPSFFVDQFWHAHMLHPKLYATSCIALIGSVIDHEPGYTGAESEKSSPPSHAASKMARVFHYEHQYQTHMAPHLKDPKNNPLGTSLPFAHTVFCCQAREEMDYQDNNTDDPNEFMSSDEDPAAGQSDDPGPYGWMMDEECG